MKYTVPLLAMAAASLAACTVTVSKDGSASASATGGAATAKPSATTAPAKPPAATATAAASASAAPAKPRPTAKPVAKEELDKKPDAAAKVEGDWITIPNTTGSFLVPKTWKKVEGTNADWVVYGGPDDKAGFIATTYGKGEDPTGKLGAVTTGLGFTDCVWSNPQDTTVGADDFAAKVADGVCLQGDTWVYVIYATISGSDINVFTVGGWDDGATDAQAAELLSIFRSIKNNKK